MRGWEPVNIYVSLLLRQRHLPILEFLVLLMTTQPFRRTCSKLIDRWNIWWKPPPSKIMFRICRENLPPYDWLGLMFEVFFAFLFLDVFFPDPFWPRWPPNSSFRKSQGASGGAFEVCPLGGKAQVTWMRRSRLFAFLIWLVDLDYL